MRFTDEQKALLIKLSESENENKNPQAELYMSCGKLVEIQYVKHLQHSQHWRNDMPVYKTHGIVVNISTAFVYIINKNGCFENIRMQDIRQMTEIKI